MSAHQNHDDNRVYVRFLDQIQFFKISHNPGMFLESIFFEMKGSIRQDVFVLAMVQLPDISSEFFICKIRVGPQRVDIGHRKALPITFWTDDNRLIQSVEGISIDVIKSAVIKPIKDDN